jgi:drug/metabolite transporter (DMT)-like permease
MYLAILLMGLLDYMLSDYLWARAVILLGPTMVRGCGLLCVVAPAPLAHACCKFASVSDDHLMTAWQAAACMT